MKFVDEAEIEVQAGKGGAGAKHFRREKFVPYGGPDGGNGGRGGSVILVADTSVQTLLDFKYQAKCIAEPGEPGGGAGKDGKFGQDLRVVVPVGTQVFQKEGFEDESTRQLVADLDKVNSEFVLAAGGRGGKGNAFFKSATNQAPEHAQPGEPGEGGSYVLSLKLVGDVGLVGFPNAGKSTLISRISAAKPKIADYPFTTLTPNLGVVKSKTGRTFVVADIPGLIEGASEGKGLGIKFLKHVERTRVLAHLIDISGIENDSQDITPLNAYDIINKELEAFSKDLVTRTQVIVLTKIDSIFDRSKVDQVIQSFKHKGFECLAISAVSGEGVPELVEALSKLVAACIESEQ